MDVAGTLGIEPTILAAILAANFACFLAGLALGFAVAARRDRR